MAERIAQNPAGQIDDQNLQDVDEAIDRVLVGLQTIQEKLPLVDANEQEDAARKKIMDIMETAINPYFADILEAFDVFEGTE
jgi:hypothetical protein